MNKVFVEKMCSCCKNKNCSKKILIERSKQSVTYRCEEYIQDKSKIKPYEKPLVVTAKRDYVSRKQF